MEKGTQALKNVNSSLVNRGRFFHERKPYGLKARVCMKGKCSDAL
jgi:hypothetical protein